MMAGTNGHTPLVGKKCEVMRMHSVDRKCDDPRLTPLRTENPQPTDPA
jgi:hypothetical protein